MREVDSGLDRADQIGRTRHCSLAWWPDGSGFYYTRYPGVGEVPRGEETYWVKVYSHALGTEPAGDSLVFGDGRPREDWPEIRLSPDGRRLVALVAVGWTRTDLYIKALDRPDAPWQTIVEGGDHLYSVEMTADSLYIQTNEGAPRGRLFRTSLDAPARAGWREIVPEGPDALQSFKLAGGRLFLHYLHNASSLVRVAGADGRPERELAFPVMGSVNAIAGEPGGGPAWIAFDSFFQPPLLYTCDPASGALTPLERVEAPVDPAAFELKQLSFPSKDGTSVSMFVMHRKGLTLDGKNPALLYGYGGFDVPLTPGFGRDLIAWLEQGGVYAVANLRGGGEYGEEWHRAGMLDRKQNVFDDFTAAAQFLIRQKYSSAARLAIQGGSNGGLLVGAALVQHPELYRAVVCQVPLLDMLRYQRFLLARLWIPEYGSADDPAQFAWLHAWSPYHRVVPGTSYPAVLLSTAESDTRVAPMHARKMAARLQAASVSGRPVLLRMETKAGHGAGKPLQKQIEEAVDVWSFLFMELRVPAPGSAPAVAKPATGKKSPGRKSPAPKKTTTSSKPKSKSAGATPDKQR